MRPQNIFFFLALLLLLLGKSFAQSVRWDPPGGQLGFNQVSQLSLVFDDCEPDGDPSLPQVDGLQFGRPSQSSQTSIVNFKMSRTFSFVFPVRPEKRAPVDIPAFDIKTDKGTIRVPAARFTVGDAPVGSSGLTVNDVASATLETPKRTVWAGEVFPVTYTLDVMRRYFHSLGSNVEWAAAPAVADDWTKPDPGETIVRGERRVVSIQSTRASVKAPGIYSLKPAAQMINLMVGTSGFGLFSQPNVEQRQIETKALEVTVKSLPPAPAGFSGAVGAFTFVSKVVPVTAGVGEPVTWTLELTGNGNWPDITGLPQREVSNDFQVVQPKSKRAMKEGTLFEGTLTEDVVLVPTKPGSYKLPPVRFSYFDPESGTFKTIASEPVTVTVTPGTTPVLPPANSGAPVQFSLGPSNPNPKASVMPAAVTPLPPENLPRDPIDRSATGHIPLTTSRLMLLCILTVLLCPLILWLVLAARRSRTLDPQRRRREALAALSTTLPALRSAKDLPAALACLRAWQTETAMLWEIPHAAPGAALVQTCVSRFSGDAGSAWNKLWTEADRSLHSRENSLPADWMMRAEAALQAVKVPGWNPLSLFAGRHLLPFLFSIMAIAVLTTPISGRAESASEAYKRGEFAGAEHQWQSTVQSTPDDWVARHNLGLALAQQDRWAEATAHWTSAFLLNSRSDVSRWDLSLGVQHSGLANPTLVELSRAEGRYKLARMATPGEWQLALIGAALLLATALIVLLLQGFRQIGGWGKPTALSATLLAMMLAATATFSLHTYGQLAEPAAVFVWKPTVLRSVPTAADTTQKTTALSAGTIAVTEKSFLGWTKLTFAGGQSGWVRTEDLIRLYR